jgi:hypothetical protein
MTAGTEYQVCVAIKVHLSGCCREFFATLVLDAWTPELRPKKREQLNLMGEGEIVENGR